MRSTHLGRRARLALALVAGLAVAASGTAATASTPAEEVTIRFTWWGNPERDAKTIEMVEMFEEAYPHIDVEAEPTVFDGYFDKLAVGFAAG